MERAGSPSRRIFLGDVNGMRVTAGADGCKLSMLARKVQRTRNKPPDTKPTVSGYKEGPVLADHSLPHERCTNLPETLLDSPALHRRVADPPAAAAQSNSAPSAP